MRSTRGAIVAVAAVLAVAVAGCSSGGGEDHPAASEAPEAASPLADCDQLTAPPAGGERALATDGEPLPALTLACFTGEEPIELTELRGPAVINLWASWCPPCREELPALQRYAERAAGEVHVIGVVTQDTRARAAALADDLEIDFPALYDRDGELLGSLGMMNLPVTLFVGESGELRYLHLDRPYDDARLAELVTEHLGVTVPEAAA